MAKLSALSLTSSQQQEFEVLARDVGVSAGYKWLSPEEVPSAVPLGLRNKFTSALLMWERTSSGCTMIVCNGVRYDKPANALDQEPFGVAVYSSGASTSGVFLHHGSWPNRTTPITGSESAVLGSTSLGNYFPLNEPPHDSSGPLSDLSFTSHEGAFQATVNHLQTPSA